MAHLGTTMVCRGLAVMTSPRGQTLWCQMLSPLMYSHTHLICHHCPIIHCEQAMVVAPPSYVN